MADGSIADFNLASYRGKTVVLFFYPLDFTFVCPSEILAFNAKVADFTARNTAVIGVSVDSVYTHYAWRETAVENGGIGKIDFPLVADLDKNIARAYGVLLNESVALRGLFLIDTHGTVRHALVNDLPLGRSVDEALRLVDALHFVEEHGEVCPANWKQGEEGMAPTADGVASYLGKKYAKK
jgi:peroxiredoxin (alkyl hydroperoxide reductase subunit C)